MEAAPHPFVLPLFQWAAFWVAVLAFRGERPLRFIAGLGLGAALARLGWGLLHFDRVAVPLLGAGLESALGGWLGPGAGLSLLFVPAGPLVLAPWRQGPGARLRHAAAASRALAPAFAVARLGCVLAGCCSGRPGAGSGPVHPTAFYEMLGWGAAALVLARTPARWTPGLFLLVFGALRGITEPWRAPPPLGEPVLDPSWIAAAWFGAGLALCGRGPAPRSDRLAPAPEARTPGPEAKRRKRAPREVETTAGQLRAAERGASPWSSS